MNKHVKSSDLCWFQFVQWSLSDSTRDVCSGIFGICNTVSDNGIFRSSLTENLSLEKSDQKGEIFDFEKEAFQLLQAAGKTSEEITTTQTTPAIQEQPLQEVNALEIESISGQTIKNSTYDSPNVINLRIDEYLQYKNDKGKIPEGRD